MKFQFPALLFSIFIFTLWIHIFLSAGPAPLWFSRSIGGCCGAFVFVVHCCLSPFPFVFFASFGFITIFGLTVSGWSCQPSFCLALLLIFASQIWSRSSIIQISHHNCKRTLEKWEHKKKLPISLFLCATLSFNWGGGICFNFLFCFWENQRVGPLAFVLCLFHLV